MWHEHGLGVLPGAALLAAAPLVVRAMRVALCFYLALRCSFEAARVGPLVPLHEQLGWVAAPFYGAVVLDALATLLLVGGKSVMDG